MNAVLFSELGKRLPALRMHEPVAPHATFQVGGVMEYFFPAQSEAELVGAIIAARELAVPYYLVAGGSNLVFGDGVVEGLAIKIDYGTCTREGDTVIVDAGAGL